MMGQSHNKVLKIKNTAVSENSGVFHQQRYFCSFSDLRAVSRVQRRTRAVSLPHKPAPQAGSPGPKKPVFFPDLFNLVL